MKRFTYLPVVFVLGLAGCEAGTEADLISRTNQVVEATKTGCSFAPTAASIAALLGVQTDPNTAAIAKKICDQVNKLPVFESGGDDPVVVTVDGLPVEGVRI